jgi:hypothetical protein
MGVFTRLYAFKRKTLIRLIAHSGANIIYILALTTISTFTSWVMAAAVRIARFYRHMTVLQRLGIE